MSAAGKGDTPRPCDAPTYRENYDRIFGKREPETPHWTCAEHAWTKDTPCPDCAERQNLTSEADAT